VAYVRTVRTGSGAIAVQIVHGSRRGARDIEHLGSAQDSQAVEALKAVARQRLAGGQGELDLGVDAQVFAAAGTAPLQIASSQMTPLWGALCSVYAQLGFDTATTEQLPTATTVMDPFHVVRLAGDALDRCRRRVQQDLHGHRGGSPRRSGSRTTSRSRPPGASTSA
jgi:hypothetical protein